MLCCLSLAAAALASPLCSSQTPGWVPTFGGTPGLNNVVRALTVFDDGGGEALFVGGDFTSAGGDWASHVAKWDGTGWSALDTGVDDSVSALAVFDDGGGAGAALYAAGSFTNAGSLAANRIAKWDGTAWSALQGGTDDSVSALAVFDDQSGSGPALFAAGSFTSVGGVGASRIARWDGTNWSALGGGLDDSVSALTVFDEGSGAGPALYAAGSFTSAGGVPSNRIARWDGTQWNSVGSGMDDSVLALAVFDDGGGAGMALYAGGDFTSAGGMPASRVAKWDGTTWSALGSGVNDSLRALTVFDDQSGGGPALYAAGDFANAGGSAASSIAKWDGSSWSALAAGLSEIQVGRALVVYDDPSGGPGLVAGGDFKCSGGVAANRVSRWDGTSWTALGSGISDSVLAQTVFDDGNGSALFVGGLFKDAGTIPMNCIARWDGTNWSALGLGMDGDVRALFVFDEASGGGPALFAGGLFKNAGGAAANHVARWDGASWTPLAGGVGDTVYALAVFDDQGGGGPALYAGGDFVSAGGVAANRIARWNGAGWSAVGSGAGGLNLGVRALAVFDDGSGPALYVAGRFTSAGGAPANRIAKWDGTSWSPVGSGGGGLDNSAVALMVFDDPSGAGAALYVGGDFTNAGGVSASFIAKWDGSLWAPLGTGAGGLNNSVRSLGVFDDGSGPDLIVGGRFTVAGGAQAQRIAKWDGASWSALGGGASGMNGSVRTLGVFDDQSGAGPALHAGGRFVISPARDSFLARWGYPSPPPTGQFCTAKTTLMCGAAQLGASGSASATATSGFVVQAQPVRACRAGLLLYSNQSVQPGVSFGGPGDGVLCLFGMGLRRAGPIESGGTMGACDGVLAIDMNRFNTSNWTAGGCNPAAGQTSPAGFLGNMGLTVNAQMWGRDSIATGQVLTGGVAWVVGP